MQEMRARELFFLIFFFTPLGTRRPGKQSTELWRGWLAAAEMDEEAFRASVTLCVSPSKRQVQQERLLDRPALCIAWGRQRPLRAALELAARHYGLCPEFAEFDVVNEQRQCPPDATAADLLALGQEELDLTISATQESIGASDAGESLMVGARVSCELSFDMPGGDDSDDAQGEPNAGGDPGEWYNGVIVECVCAAEITDGDRAVQTYLVRDPPTAIDRGF